jgi:hypothetical protein
LKIPDHISENLEAVFWAKIIKFFDADPDPVFGNLFDPISVIRDGNKIGSGIQDKHPRSATLPDPDPYCLYGSGIQAKKIQEKLNFCSIMTFCLFIGYKGKYTCSK